MYLNIYLYNNKYQEDYYNKTNTDFWDIKCVLEKFYINYILKHPEI